MHQPDSGAGFQSLALEVNERARARSLLDTLADAHIDSRQGVSPELLAREQQLQRLIAAKAERQARKAGRGSDEEDNRKQEEKASLLAQYQDVQAEIRFKSAPVAAVAAPQILSASAIQHELLDQDTLLLEAV